MACPAFALASVTASEASHPRPPARGGPTIRGGSTSPTIRPYIVGPPLAGGLRRPVVACGGLWWPAGGRRRPVVACGGLWRPVCGGLWWPVVAGLGGGLGVVREQLTLIFWQFHKNLPFFPLTFF